MPCVSSTTVTAERQRSVSPHFASFHALQETSHAAPAPLACNQDTGIEDYSHVGGFHGPRLLMISSRSAAKSGSIVARSPALRRASSPERWIRRAGEAGTRRLRDAPPPRARSRFDHDFRTCTHAGQHARSPGPLPLPRCGSHGGHAAIIPASFSSPSPSSASDSGSVGLSVVRCLCPHRRWPRPWLPVFVQLGSGMGGRVYLLQRATETWV